MPIEDILSDDYVAALLKKDASDSTARYALSGLLPKR
jgi:hypothetical protein